MASKHPAVLRRLAYGTEGPQSVAKIASASTEPKECRQTLSQPHQQVIDLGDLGTRFGLRNFAERESVLATLVTENDAKTAVAILKGGYGSLQCHCNAVTILLPTVVGSIVRREE